MKSSFLSSARQVGMMACMLLALLFAGIQGANVVDRLQHDGTHVAAHEHNIVSLFSLEETASEGDHTDGGAVLTELPDSTGDMPGHFHHHHGGDHSSSLIASVAELEPVGPRSSALAMPPVVPIAGMMLPMPERPPRDSLLIL